MDSALRAAIQIGGWGCCTGRGQIAQSLELEERAFVTPDRLGPGGHDQLIGFFETPTGFGRVDAVPEVFRRDAAHKPRDQPPRRRDSRSWRILPATRTGCWRRGRMLPRTPILIRCVRWLRAAAIRFGDGIVPYAL